MENKTLIVIKKDGTREEFNPEKIVIAVGKSASRILIELTDQEKQRIVDHVLGDIEKRGLTEIPISTMHSLVEGALQDVNEKVYKSYCDYRNYKKEFVHMMDEVYKKSQSIRYIGDKDNANTDSALVATKRSLIFNELNKELYRKFFMTRDELQACKEGYIYVHDQSARLDTLNCCLFNAKEVFTGGFEMGNIWYNEPKSLDTAFDVLGDVILSTAAQQYGGFTVPEVDTFLEPYAEKSFAKYKADYIANAVGIKEDVEGDLFRFTDPANESFMKKIEKKAEKYADNKVRRDFEQGMQGIEYKLNTVGSSRGDYPFITFTFGLGTGHFAKMCSIAMMKVHQKGQGKEGFKRPVLFSKYVFLYDENIHGEGKSCEDVFEAAIECSSKTMYPDYLSLTGEGYVAGIYKKYGRAVSPMGCRAFLSPWYERGGMEPADEDDKPVYIGRCNLGAVSLHLPMILAKARRESRDFYEVLDYYMEMIRNLHKRTYDYIGEMRASVNPTMFCEGGLLGGHLDPKEKIRKLLPPMTMSFGITALNELQELYNGKSLVEDNEFCLEVMKYINDKIKVYKEEDHILYAIYGTPAESLCVAGDTQIQTYTGNKCISEIVPGDLVYSFNEKKHKVELKKVMASRMTRRNAETVKVTFDNGQEVICTPNHEFAVRKSMGMVENGKRMRPEYIEYVAASKLKPGDRIKSNYITVNSAGRVQCSIYNNGAYQLIQNINAEYAYGEKPAGYVVHHKDSNKENNSFENLVYMSAHDHKVLHMDLTIGKHCYTSDSQTGKKNSFYGKHQTEENNLYNRKFHIYKPVIQKDIAGNVVKVYECIQDVKKDGYSEHLVRLACRGERHITDKVVDYHYYKDSLWYYGEHGEYEAAAEANHKVVSVTPVGSMDVYDIEVEDNHNFFVGGSNGILVHNCYLQIQQFRKEFGVVPKVSDRPYVSNSFHCHVTEDISPVQKQDREHEFWDYFNGGKIQYVRYPLSYNVDAVRSLVRRAMKMGFYEGVNLSLAYCDDCGHEELEMDVCPKCGSRNLTKIDRMNGYLAYSRKHGDTRLNAGKMAEIADRVSM